MSLLIVSGLPALLLPVSFVIVAGCTLRGIPTYIIPVPILLKCPATLVMDPLGSVIPVWYVTLFVDLLCLWLVMCIHLMGVPVPWRHIFLRWVPGYRLIVLSVVTAVRIPLTSVIMLLLVLLFECEIKFGFYPDLLFCVCLLG